jgi:glycosyltransferase involved in cell wall biosynthesis
LSFFYPCSLAEHKNLKRLLIAWEKAFYINDQITLYLTLPGSWFTKNKIIAENINVFPLGTLDYPLLMEWYQNCEYVIFPSYCESFGLPLIEGIENGCKIVASDLPFTHSIIDPFAVFDPYSADSIKDSIINIATQQEPSKFGKNKINIENKIIQILSMIYYGKI